MICVVQVPAININPGLYTKIIKQKMLITQTSVRLELWVISLANQAQKCFLGSILSLVKAYSEPRVKTLCDFSGPDSFSSTILFHLLAGWYIYYRIYFVWNIIKTRDPIIWYAV